MEFVRRFVVLIFFSQEVKVLDLKVNKYSGIIFPRKLLSICIVVVPGINRVNLKRVRIEREEDIHCLWIHRLTKFEKRQISDTKLISAVLCLMVFIFK